MRMKITVEILAALLQRGWRLEHTGEMFCFRRPDGVSGSPYQTRDLDYFPDCVGEWVLENIPLVPV